MASTNVVSPFQTSIVLEVANVGCKPTFNNAIREEGLDLTLVSNSIVSSLVNWRIKDETTLSDHQHHRFHLTGPPELLLS